MATKLYRPKKDRIVAGVCSGLAEYFQVDVVIIRLIFVLLTVSGGAGVLAYIILLIVMPEEEGESYADSIKKNINTKDKEEIKSTIKKTAEDIKEVAKKNSHNSELFAIILVAVGIIFLIQNLLPSVFNFSRLWPLLLVVVGIVILISSKKKE